MHQSRIHIFFEKLISLFNWSSKNRVSYKSHYYQTCLNRIDSWEKLYKISSDTEVIVLPEDKQILFFDVPFGVSLSTVIKRFGKPRFYLY